MLKKFYYPNNVTFLCLQTQKQDFQGHEIQIFLNVNGRMQVENKVSSENVLANAFHFINIQIIAIFFFYFFFSLLFK